MRFYRRTPQDKEDTAFNRCLIDAKEGRVWLALLRLQDLSEEFPEDSLVIHGEAIIRRDFLGQGIMSQELFKKAFELDNRNTYAACNAAKYSPNRNEFESWAEIALHGMPDDKPLKDMVALQKQIAAAGQPHWEFLQMLLRLHGSTDNGPIAALLELILNTGAGDLEPKVKENYHEVRIEKLRALDRAADERLQFLGEQFLPEDRLALKEALAELEKAMVEGCRCFYDPKLWNLRAAYEFLMRNYQQTISYAERAIELLPVRYALPHLNKALAYWELGEEEKGLVCIREAELQAHASGDRAQLVQVQQAQKNHAAFKKPKTLKEILPHLRKVIAGSGDAAYQEILDERGRLENVSQDLLKRVHAVGSQWSMAHIPIIAELLSFYSPEAASFIVARASLYEPILTDNILNAALYLMAHTAGVTQRDSARFLALSIIAPLSAEKIRQVYRQGILEVSAAATDELSHLDSIMRRELLRIHPLLPPMVADQEPVKAAGVARARRNILARFEDGISLSDFEVAGFRDLHPKKPWGCTLSLIIILIWFAFIIRAF